MKKRPAQRGFTLVEMMVSSSIASIALMSSAPFLSDWTYSRQTKDANSKVLSAYRLAKALALRNPEGVGVTAAAAGVKLVTGSQLRVLYVCKGDPATAACGNGGANVLWSADFPAVVTMTLGGASVAGSSPVTLALNNRGAPTTGTVLRYTLSRGGSASAISSALL